MSRHFLISISLVVICCGALAQTPTMLLLSADSSFKTSDALVQFSGAGMVGSNSLDNLFLKKSVFGGHLENDHLDRIASKLKDQNRAGFLLTSGLDFYNFRDTLFNHPQWGIHVGISTTYSAALSFSRDLYKTIYRGNAQFAGDTAQLGPLAAQYQSYQKFGVGIFNKHTLSGVTLSLVAGENYQSLILSEAGMYTSPLGDSLALNYAGDYMRSDTTKRGFANGSGIGLALDFNVNIPLVDHRGVISIAVNDVGFVAWNQLSEHYTFDSLTTWTGLQVNDVFELATDTLDLPGLKDSLHYQVRKKSFFAPLPASIHVRFSRFFSANSFYEAGLSIWPNRAAVPVIYGSLNHFLGTHFMVSERVTFGGYSRGGVGAEIQWMPRGSWLLRVGSNHLEGFVMDKAHGMDGYFTLAKTFGSASMREAPETSERTTRE